MNELIERLEQATGPDRELDVEIVFALYPDIGAYQPHCRGEEPIFWNEPYRKQPCPEFTKSIDAALTLVPEEHAASVEWSPRYPGCAWIYPPDNVDEISFEGEASNPAIALCIAALKAREALGKGEA